MKIQPKLSIEGFPATQIRDRLQRAIPFGFSTESLAADLKATPAQTSKILKWLIAAGYIEKDIQKGTWYVTPLGGRFSTATAAKAITRATADRKLAEFLSRVEIVNRSQELAYVVSRVRVFGSYLTDSPTVNDIDLMVEIRRTFDDPTLQDQRESERKYLARASGKRFSNITEKVYWPQTEVFLFLKARSRVFHFVEVDNFEPDPVRIIYPKQS